VLLNKQSVRHHEVDPVENLWVLEKRIQQVRWQRDPVVWAKERLGIFLWSKQREIMRAIAKHRKVAIKSCHEIGKSFTCALVVLWWIDCHSPGTAYAVTSAPTAVQVRGILWKEIGRAHARSKIFASESGLEPLPGDVNQVDWQITMPAGNREIVALGRKPDEHEPTAFQGQHAEFPMYLFDEACGMPLSLFEAGDSLIANDNGKAVAVGNPDDPASHFAEICKPGSGWHVIEVGAFDTPSFTGETVPKLLTDVLIGKLYVEEKRKRWAPSWYWVDRDGNPSSVADGVRVVCPLGQEETATHPFWQSKILGKFPTVSEAGKLIPITWLMRALHRRLAPEGPKKLGVDVGRGGDSSTGCLRHGPVFRIQWEDRIPDTMHTCGQAIAFAKKHGVSELNIDTVGVGAGVVDRATEVVAVEKLPFEVNGINVGEAADDDEQFANRRAELWWAVRTRFEHVDGPEAIDLDPLDEDTQAELLEIEYTRTSSGKIQIETKEHAAKRGVPSPNRADAIMLANAEPRYVLTRATWR
jgi:hypothetical protein